MLLQKTVCGSYPLHCVQAISSSGLFFRFGKVRTEDYYTNCITCLGMEVNSSLQAFQIPVGKRLASLHLERTF